MMGIVIPMVNTADDAKRAADACRFPPIGHRSWGWGRARAYGSDYSDWIDDQIFVAVQIETKQAVENAEAIIATPGVDGCWVGPSDLSLSLGFHPSEMDERDEHAEALEMVLKACRNTGKIPGIAGVPWTTASRAPNWVSSSSPRAAMRFHPVWRCRRAGNLARRQIASAPKK